MKPEAAFSSLACWALGAALISLECGLEVLGLVSRVSSKGLVSIAGCFDLRGARGDRGRGRAGFVTTVGSRMEGFRSYNCLVLRMGFNSMDSLGFCLFSAFTGSRFIIHFIIEPDFGYGFLCVFMCVLSAPAFPHRLKHRTGKLLGRHPCSQKRTTSSAMIFFQRYYNIM